jgi:L-threonylcarbamoyladenylate synthase
MPERLDIPQAVAALRRGGVIAYPTEAVWGLGCDPFDPNAVRRLLRIKQRDESRGLILVSADLAQIASFIDLDALPLERLKEVRASWPGPHTWLLPCPSRIPTWLRGAHSTIALRISAHKRVVALCNAFGGPIVSTSANRAGHEPARSIEELDPAVIEQTDGVLEGITGDLKSPTPIRDALSGTVIRA